MHRAGGLVDPSQSELSEDFFWRPRAALDILKSVNAPDDARAEATRVWLELYRVVHLPRDETGAERGKRIDRLDELAERVGLTAPAGLSPILFYLREFWLDLTHPASFSSTPGKTLDRIIHGPPREGTPGRPFDERIAMAVEVQKRRLLGMTAEKACREIAEKTHDPHIGKDAVRRIYENVLRDEKDSRLMRVIAVSEVMDATAADPVARATALSHIERGTSMRRTCSAAASHRQKFTQKTR
jgi:hypothetical protein